MKSFKIFQLRRVVGVEEDVYFTILPSYQLTILIYNHLNNFFFCFGLAREKVNS